MIQEIRTISNRAKANYVRQLQYRKLLKVYVSEKGYVGFDPAELQAYQNRARVGRPIKNK